MLRWSPAALAKRTPGYVFWRQSSLVELEKAKRSYLMSERPVPIAEVARRMVRVRARYEAASDHHEKNLLRGEYKYFTGKLCDMRVARPSDMIAFVQCASFFGFWDVSQVGRVMSELLLKLSELTPNELLLLFISLPGVRKQRSELYQKVASKLAEAVPDLTVQECLAVCSACDDTVPASLLRALLSAIEAEAASLTPAQLVDVLDTVSVAPAAVQQQFGGLWDTVKSLAVRGSEELGCMDVAVLYTALQAGGDCDAATSRRLLQRFLSQAPTAACARSSAMMFSATAAESLTASLGFAQHMQDRALFLATDFTPAELVAVFKVYLSCLVAMTTLVESHAKSPTTASASLSTELAEAAQRQAGYRHVLEELHDQLLLLHDNASAYVSTAQQMELLEVYATAVADLEAAVTATPPSSSPDSAPSAKAHAVSVLLKQLPQTRVVMRLLADKIVAHMRSASMAQLVKLLELGNELGPSLLPDAVLSAALHELIVREWTLTGDEAEGLNEVLTGLTDLREEHQRRIRVALVPKVRSFL